MTTTMTRIGESSAEGGGLLLAFGERARKLLIARWRYGATGVVPAGAVLKPRVA